MNEVIGGGRAPAWLRIVALLGLLWNLYGVYAYLQTVGTLPGGEAMAAEMAGSPTWFTGAFAICVFAGALGSLGLLLLQRWSKLLLLLSFLTIVAQDVYVFVLRPEGPTNLGLSIAVTLVGLLLVSLAYSADKKGWLS